MLTRPGEGIDNDRSTMTGKHLAMRQNHPVKVFWRAQEHDLTIINWLRAQAGLPPNVQVNGTGSAPHPHRSSTKEIIMPIPTALSSHEAALVEQAERIARAAHKGQLDKAGLPYFESHVADVHRRVVSYGGDVFEQIAALLHDVLEDTSVTEDELRKEGIPEEALVIVRLLTKAKDEPKSDYYERIRRHEPARRVKLLADIASNTDPDRLALLPDEMRITLTQKYSQATRHLTTG